MNHQIAAAVIYRPGEPIQLVFDTMPEAVAYIEAQATNPSWRTNWTFSYTESGRAVATPKNACNVTFGPPLK